MSWNRTTYCIALASLLWLAPVKAQTPQLAPPQYGPNDGASRGLHDPGPQPNLAAQPNLGQPTLATPPNDDSREYLRLLNQPAAAPASVNPLPTNSGPANTAAISPMNVAARPEPAPASPNTQAVYQQPVATGSPAVAPLNVPATHTVPIINENQKSDQLKNEAANNAPRPLNANGAKPLPLAGPNTKSSAASSSWGSFGTMLGSLAIVLGLFVVTIKLLRRGMPGAKQKLGRDVVDVLGQTPLAPRQSLQVIRFGNKILLVAMSPDGCDTLTEITDPLEVDRLAGMCQQSQANSSTKTFGDMFRQVTSIRPNINEPADDPPASSATLDDVRARLRGGSLTNREVTHG